jgi:hypothetical protein
MSIVNFVVGCFCMGMGISLLIQKKHAGIGLANITMGILNFLVMFLK